MRNFQDTFETRKQSFIGAFYQFMIVPLIPLWVHVFIMSCGNFLIPGLFLQIAFEVRTKSHCT